MYKNRNNELKYEIWFCLRGKCIFYDGESCFLLVSSHEESSKLFKHKFHLPLSLSL